MSYEKVSNAKNVTVGCKQTLKAVKNGTVTEVMIADDADEHLKQSVRSAASEYNVPVTEVESMKELGKSCGIQVGASAIGIVS